MFNVMKLCYIIDSKMISYSHGFATALFSFLYHLASYESGICLNLIWGGSI